MSRSRRFFHFLAVLCVLASASCAIAPERFEPIPDLTRLEQRVSAYVDEDAAIIPDDLRAEAATAFLDGYFAPWRRNKPVHGAEDAFWGLRLIQTREMFGENKLPLGPEWRAEMTRLSDPDSFPNRQLSAVAVVNTSMRVLPTDKPAFYDFALAGEGFPFDMMQNSAVWAGTPLYITHISADKAWYLAECRYAFGWIPIRDVALLICDAEEFMSQGPFVTPVKDRVPLLDCYGRHLFDLRIGQILQVVASSESSYTVLAPARRPDGGAGGYQVEVPAEYVRPWPLPPTRSVIAGLAEEMIGQAYGWGGLYGNRDCSSTLMDLFAAIGVPLPRNSRIQAKAGSVIDLAGLSPGEKREIILREGKPFGTLIGKPGHIMLYIGERDGEPLIFHTAWGLKTGSLFGGEGRRIIGVTAVTGVSPGKGVSDLERPSGEYLHQISSMTFIDQETVAKTAPNDAMVE